MSDAGWLAAGCTAVGSLFSVVFTLLCTKGIPAFRDWRKIKMEERKYEDGETKEARTVLISRLESDIQELKAEVRDLREKHTSCETKYAALEAVYKFMQDEISSLRDWRHSQVNEQNAKKLVEAVVEEKAKQASLADTQIFTKPPDGQ